MNDTTLPIPSKNANPRRRPPEGRVKKGFGLHDWMTLLRHAKDLAQRKGAPIRKDISLAEVKTHNKPYDGWMVLRGKVYNITTYMAYHPGGNDILEKCVGRDATKLFDRYHSWVNLDNLVGALLLGYVAVEKKRVEEDGSNGYLKGGVTISNNNPSGDRNTILPAATATSSPSTAITITSSNDLGFAMPKPRPPKSEPIASLLPPGNNEGEDESEEEDNLMQL